MKIMYLSLNNPYRCPGPYIKELNLCKALSEESVKRGLSFQGVNIVMDYDNKNESLPQQENIHKVIINTYPFRTIINKIPIIRSLLRIFLAPLACRATVYKEIQQYKPQIVICRYLWFLHMSIGDIKGIFKDIVLITDHQTMEEPELRLYSGRFAAIVKMLEKIFFKKIFNISDALIAVSSEIAEYELWRGGKEKANFVLTNGICIENFREKKFKKIKKGQMDLLFIGSHAFAWNGLDRLFAGLSRYKGETKFFLHLVGNLEEYREAVSKEGVSEKVIFHGAIFGEALDAIFDNVHLAIGPLALHRKGFRTTSAIKVCEYLARGIPFVIGYQDANIEEDFPYVLKVPANEEPIDISAVVAFTKKIYSESGQGMIGEIRDYAKKNIDYREKVKGLMDFIEKLYKARHEINMQNDF
jgi:hypothetical protein